MIHFLSTITGPPEQSVPARFPVSAMLCCCRVMVAAAFLFHAGPFPAAAQGPTGRELCIEKCGSCHRKGGEARVFAPTKYAAYQWKRFFERKLHNRREDISHLFTPQELNAIKQYLVKHAADSEQPDVFGLRLQSKRRTGE